MEQVNTTGRSYKGDIVAGFQYKANYDYEAMWDKLRREMEYLVEKNVSTCHPTIVLGYMGFISQEERLKQLLGDKAG